MGSLRGKSVAPLRTRVKLRRLALVGLVLTASTLFAESSSRAVTTAPTTPVGLPLFQFAQTGAPPLPWNAVSLENKLNATKMLGGPHGATDASEGVLAYRTNENQLATLTQSAAGTTAWLNYMTHNNVPTPGSDPVPFFDPSGKVDLLYVDQSGHLILVSPNEPDSAIWARLHFGTPWRPYVATDLTALTGVVAAPGVASVQVLGTSATIAYLTIHEEVEVFTLRWQGGQPIPIYGQNAATVDNVGGATLTAAATSTTSTTTTTTTTTTTLPIPAAAFGSDPVVLPGATPTFASTISNGDLVVLTSASAALNSWSDLNLTALTGSTPVTGALALGISSNNIDLAALTSAGAVELFTTQYVAPVPAARVKSKPVSYGAWNVSNVTSLASGAPPLSGTLAVEVTPTQVAIAGQAANWGDLFVLSSSNGASPWTATNVSVTAGSSARTVGNVVTGLSLGGQLTLYAAGVNSPPRQGVGVYAIPSAKWTQAITDGWPIISETGGLGTRSAPWVGFTGSTTPVNQSPDFLLGQAIYNSHKRVTWLSFWTVSGPLAGQPLTIANFYSHGFAAGQWVATQIDSYRALGVGLTPDWVILDPEGYPDNHSGLDAPGGASTATLATYATYWTAMLQGWQQGLDSIDPSLNAAVYAAQSEYRNYQLSTLAMPVFVALAFGGNGPVPVSGATGTNVRGFISFGAACTPATTLANEATTLKNPPWGGQFNTLQFNSGVYCSPPST
ncbi:MAG: hypothetical protein JWM55_1870 [Acidimicrobiaceae bacterium]|nr:hypothetical protein [Acidimicrobiaceae bacterium]